MYSGCIMDSEGNNVLFCFQFMFLKQILGLSISVGREWLLSCLFQLWCCSLPQVWDQGHTDTHRHTHKHINFIHIKRRMNIKVQVCQSRLTVCDSMCSRLHRHGQAQFSMEFSRLEYWSEYLFLLQGILPT